MWIVEFRIRVRFCMFRRYLCIFSFRYFSVLSTVLSIQYIHPFRLLSLFPSFLICYHFIFLFILFFLSFSPVFLLFPHFTSQTIDLFIFDPLISRISCARRSRRNLAAWVAVPLPHSSKKILLQYQYSTVQHSTVQSLYLYFNKRQCYGKRSGPGLGRLVYCWVKNLSP